MVHSEGGLLGEVIPRCEKEPFRNIVSKTWQEIYKKF